MANEKVSIEFALEDHVSVPLKRIQSGIIRFVGAISAAIAATKAIAFPIKAAAEFQQQMLNVAKTTGFAGDSLEGLQKELLALSERLDVSAVDLAKIASIAGQLGLGSQGAAGIAAFTETTARFASVLDVTVDTAANGLAKIANIFNISLKEAERISSAFNELSNNSTASGEALLNVVQRLGNAAGTLNLQESLGLAATGVDFGLTLETIGTSFTKVFSNMQSRAEKFAKFMGVSTEEWTNTVKSGGIPALKAYLEQLLKVDSATRAYTINTLSGGGRIFSLVNKLLSDAANGYLILDKNLGEAQDGWDTGTSSMEEHAKVLSGVIAQLKVLGNVITKTAIDIGNLSLPYIGNLVASLKEFFADPKVIDGFTQLGKSIGNAVTKMVDMVKWVASLNINWANLANTLLLIVEIKIGVLFLKLISILVLMGNHLYRVSKGWITLGATLGGLIKNYGAEFIKKWQGVVAAGTADALVGAAKAAEGEAEVAFSQLGAKAGSAFSKSMAASAATGGSVAGAQNAAAYAGVAGAKIKEAGLAAQTEQTVRLSQAVYDETAAFVAATDAEFQNLEIKRTSLNVAKAEVESRIATTQALIAEKEATIAAAGAMGAQPAALRAVRLATADLSVAKKTLIADTIRLNGIDEGLIITEKALTTALAEQAVITDRLVAARGRAAALSVAEAIGSVARRRVLPFQDLAAVQAVGGILDALRTKFAAFGRATGIIGIAMKGLTFITKGLGVAFRFLLGPWGLAITIGGSLLGLFDGLGDKIVNFLGFLGFTTKAEQEAARATRIANAEFSDQAEKIRGMADAYDEVVKKQGEFKLVDIGEVFATSGAKGVETLQNRYEAVITGINAKLEKLKKDFEINFKSLNEVEFKLISVDRQLTDANARAADLQQKKLIQQNPQSSGYDVLATGLPGLVDYDALITKEKQRADILKKQKEELKQQRTELQAMIDSYDAGFGIKGSGNYFDPAVQEEVISLNEQKKSVLESIAQFGDKLTAQAANLALDLKISSGILAQIDAQIKDTVAKQKEIASQDNPDVTEKQKIDEQLDELKRQRAEADAAVTKAKASLTELEKKATTSTSKAQVETGKKIIENIKDEGAAIEANAAIQSQATRDKSLYILAQQKELNQAVGIVVQSEKIIGAYKRVADEATRIGDSIKGFAKKIESELEKLSDPINKVRRELASIAETRLADKSLQKDIDFITETFDAGIKSANKYRQARIDALKEAGGNKQRIKALEDDRDLLEALAEKQKADLITTDKAKAAFLQMQTEVKQLVKIKDTILTLRDQAQKADNENNLQLRDAIQKQLNDELDKAQDINKSLAKARKDFATGVYDITSQGIEQPAIDTKQLDKLLAQVEVPLEEQRKLTLTMAKEADLITKTRADILKLSKEKIEVENKGDYKKAEELTTLIAQKEEAVTALQKQINEQSKGSTINAQIADATRQTSDALTKNIEQMVSDVVQQYQDLKSATDEAQAKIDEIVKTLHISPEALEAIKKSWGNVENVFTHLADTIKGAGIQNLLSVAQSVDPSAVNTAFARITETARATQGITGQILDKSPLQDAVDQTKPVVVPNTLAPPDPQVVKDFIAGYQEQVDKTGGLKIPAKVTNEGLPPEYQQSGQPIPQNELKKISKEYEKPVHEGIATGAKEGAKEAVGLTTEEFNRNLAIEKALGPQVTTAINEGAKLATPKITGIIYEIKDKSTGDTTVTDKKPINIAGKVVKLIPPKDLPAAPVVIDGDTFVGSINDALSGKVFTINAKINTTGSGGPIPGFASGGPVRGPGTGISDSILSWVSHGEYIIDAATTRFFGSDFFRNLQYVVRKGLASPKAALAQLLMPAMKNTTISNNIAREQITRIISSIPGFARGGPVAVPSIPSMAFTLPAFASGGAVDSVDGGLVQAIGNVIEAQKTTPAVSERVQLDISIGSDRYSVNGSRDQVRGLVNALKDISRSTRRG